MTAYLLSDPFGTALLDNYDARKEFFTKSKKGKTFQFFLWEITVPSIFQAPLPGLRQLPDRGHPQGVLPHAVRHASGKGAPLLPGAQVPHQRAEGAIN